MEDDVLKEVRAFRDAFAAAHGYDIHAMMLTLREQTIANGWVVVRLPPRQVVEQAVLPVPQVTTGETQQSSSV